MPSQSLLNAAERVMALAKEKRLTLVTAESCTSGLLAAVLSEAPGAAELLHGGFVTYTKCHKTIALGVPEALLTRKGAVCPEVAAAMAQGALARSAADLATAITGVAGPSPDEDGNPVGLVCLAVARRGFPTVHICKEYGDIGRDAMPAGGAGSDAGLGRCDPASRDPAWQTAKQTEPLGMSELPLCKRSDSTRRAIRRRPAQIWNQLVARKVGARSGDHQ